jgi:predicted ABC-class ATPase|tara:strand:+ start:939 stop:1157 length:219 start_codon:yes stop_codon:yes gene_type:complete
MKNETLIRNFLEGKEYESNNSLTNRDNKLYSYNLAIADRNKKEIYKVSYSKTTSTHINRVIDWARGYTVIEQ